MAKDLNIHFSKEDTQMADKPMKRCMASLIIREIQIKTTMGYYFIVTRMSHIRVTDANNVGKDVEKLELSCIYGGNVK